MSGSVTLGARCFVTGTDTGVGKTRVACTLVHALRGRGTSVAAMKPVASGSIRTVAGWRNDDGEALLASTGLPLPYEDVNPYALKAPTAPDIAAARQGTTVELEVLDRAFMRLAAECPSLVVEGVGGWMAPLAGSLMQADLCRRWQLPIVLVVGLRLGCISHALLTRRAIEADGLACVGWIGNHVDADLLHVEETLALLDRHLGVPRLGLLPHALLADPAALTPHVDERCLLRALGIG